MPSTWNPPRFRFLPQAVVPVFALAVSLGLPAQASSLHAEQSAKTAQQTRIVKRQNLRPVNYANSSSSGAQVRVGVRNPNRDDIVVHRPSAEADRIQPLTDQAALRSEVAFVQDLESADVLYDKNSDEVRPIASISKLMTALVVAEADLPMDEMLTISSADVDRLRYSRSRLPVGTELSRADMLHLALMSSENRAAHALGRYYPGGMPAFVRAMNDKARALGMRNTHFVEPTGLSSDNVSTPRDLVKLLRATSQQPLIHRYTTDDKYEVTVGRGRQLVFNNTNRLVRNAKWDIKVSKTGFINEAGECLVMLTRIDQRDVAIVLLNSTGRYSRIGDAVRIRTLVENDNSLAML
ncbi:D-alanyl-D-alanine endopeptidase [Pusillimonas sp. SM2304]|uniref:D-alanyl-D-alanine endopeptidase n=1 Tax=Pusillimonas sp. SM2304 TaxID=3073241 RepID=UPI002875A628|nr:D-alanyl-D-alanine endopeptidase [Pusillimonas sp. SM2304]MDS1141628.1 D-alanyl-D-alanine endopeptidase [Pusillimonas sp. SM2304]